MAAAAALTLSLIRAAGLRPEEDERAPARRHRATVAEVVPTEVGGCIWRRRWTTTVARWSHVRFVVITGMVVFVVPRHRPHVAAWTIIAARCVVLAGNFLLPQPNFTWREISTLKQIPFLGEQVSVIGSAVTGPWQWLATGSVLLFAIYIADATVTLWRRGGSDARRRATLVGGGMLAFVVLSIAETQLVVWGIVRAPVIVTPLFLLTIATMAYELSREFLRSARTTAELKEISETMSLAAATARLALWRWDIRKDVILSDNAGRALYGIPPDTPITFQTFAETLHPDDRAMTEQAVRASLSGDGGYHASYRIVLPGGAIRWIEAAGRVEFDRAKRPLHMVGVSADVTERRRMQDNFRLAVEASPNGMVLANAEGRILLVNDRVAAMFGYERAELLEQPMEMLLPLHFSRDVAPRATHDAAHARAVSHARELHARRKDGSEFRVEIRINSAEGVEGTLVLIVIVDITERRKAERDARELREELSHTSRVTMLSELSGSLAHELSQPLAAILRNAEAAEMLLHSTPPDFDELYAIVTDIRRDDERAGAVIERMRAMLKRRDVERQPGSVEALVRDALALARVDAHARHVVLDCHIAPGLPAVLGDRVQLCQVLLNLILNGMDAVSDTRNGDRRVVVEAHPSEGLGVELTVKDNGHGIAPELTEKIFDSFFTTKPNGLGIGLAVSRRIVEAHGGRLWAGNNPDSQGAFFRFTLPVAQQARLS
jgi:PAS domain S-box-containing protein